MRQTVALYQKWSHSSRNDSVGSRSDAGSAETESLSDNELENAGRRGTKGHAHADFGCALPHDG